MVLALLANILVFPGAGQVMAGRKLRGILYLLAVLAVLGSGLYQSVKIVGAESNVPEVKDALTQIAKAVRIEHDNAKAEALMLPLADAIFARHEFVIDIYLFLLGSLYILCTMDLILIYLDQKNDRRVR